LENEEPDLITCDECSAVFKTPIELENHKARRHVIPEQPEAAVMPGSHED
jgi:hypothetical protein